MAFMVSDWKGTEWKGWDDVRKAYFVWGFRDGQNSAASTLLTMPGQKPDSKAFRRANERIGIAASVEQIVSGIDSVYSDYRNLNLPLWEVCGYVIDSIGGFSHQSDLELMRKVYNRPQE